MKKLNYSFIIIFLILSFQISYSSEKKRDIILKNSSISFGTLPFLKRLSGEINLRKGVIFFNNSFSLFDGSGLFKAEYRKKDKIYFKLDIKNINFPYPLGGIGNISGFGEGPISNYSSNFIGDFKNLIFYLRNKVETTEIELGHGKIKSSNTHSKKNIDININILGEKVDGKINITYDNFKKIVNGGSFEIKLKNISLFNTSENLINLGKKIDKFNIIGVIENNIIVSKIVLNSPLLSLLGNIKILKNKKISGKIKIEAKKEAIGKNLKIPWFSYLIKSKLSTIVELSGNLQKPIFKIIELK